MYRPSQRPSLRFRMLPSPFALRLAIPLPLGPLSIHVQLAFDPLEQMVFRYNDPASDSDGGETLAVGQFVGVGPGDPKDMGHGLDG